MHQLISVTPNMLCSCKSNPCYRISLTGTYNTNSYFHGPVTGSLHAFETETALERARSQVAAINRTSHRRLSALYITTDFTSSCLSHHQANSASDPTASMPSNTSPLFKLTSAIETLKTLSDRCTNYINGDALRQQLIDMASVVMACVTEDVITVSILEGFDQAFEDIGHKLGEMGFGKETGKVAKLVVVRVLASAGI